MGTTGNEADAKRRQADVPSFWRSWLFRAPLLMVIWVVVLRLGWGAYRWNQWQASRANLLAAGFVLQAPAASPAGDPIDDAIDLAVKAVAFEDSPSASMLEYPGYPPYRRAWWTLAEKSESRNQRAMSLLRAARQLIDRTPGLMSIRYESALLFSNYNDPQGLANILGDSVVRNHLVGNDAEAIERCSDMFALASAVRRGSTTVSQLVAVGLDALAIDRGEIVAAGLMVGNPSVKSPASEQQVRALLGRVLDEEDIWRNMAACAARSPAEIIPYAEQSAKDTWLIAPLLWRDLHKLSEDMKGNIAAFNLRDAVSRGERFSGSNQPPLPFLAKQTAFGVPYSHYYAAYTTNDGVVRQNSVQLRLIGQRRTFAVLLAMRLYLAAEGHLPEKLEDLSPKYLPAIPKDPFFNDGRTIGMKVFPKGLPGGGDRVMIYYDAGKIVREPLPTPTFGWNQDHERKPGDPVNEIRQWCDVTRWYVGPTTSATEILPPAESDERVEYDAAKADGKGEQADPGKDGE